MKLLTPAHANAKTAKNTQFAQFQTYILHLAPAKLSGYNMCPAASAGCAAACLNTAGRGAFSNVQQARIRKTKLFVEHKAEFMQLLKADLDAVQRKATKAGRKAVVRLNGTSDVQWELVRFFEHKNVFEAYPNIQFYDYTKILRRLERLFANPIANYHVTFSRAEDNTQETILALTMGFNVAAVFSGDVPKEFLGAKTIDGDSHDLRFLDAKGKSVGHIVALKAKGKAKKDLSGFVVQQSSCNAAKAG